MKITVETKVAASIETVWDAYTTPADIKQWNAASSDWHTTTATVDLREGGKFSSRMEAKDGSMGFDFAGTYTKIVKNKLIEYSFGDRAARVEFMPGPQGVAVRVAFDSEQTHSIEQQRQGWQSILDNFARHVEAKVHPTSLSQRATVQPYLFFRGRCEEAIEYYKAKLDAEVLLQMRFKDNPDKPGPDKVPPVFDQRIMHACVRIAGAELFMSDGMRSGPTDFDCVSLSLNLPTEAEADRIFNALAVDGKITMPIGKTFFAQRFGGVTDKFGVQWMVIVQPTTT
jgi:uncharacterized glyoxalase superfamily protein PhnB/uncharacterized protein YndB with AHSA1/START domain